MGDGLASGNACVWKHECGSVCVVRVWGGGGMWDMVGGSKEELGAWGLRR